MMLWRKLIADARALARHTVALMVLVGLGVMLFVGMYESYQNLDISYGRIYETGRLADASVLFDSGPEGLVGAAQTIPGVTNAIGRIRRDGTIDQPGRKHERVRGRFIGLPRGQRPELNDLLILEGRYLASPDEAVLEQQFAGENDYHLGDTITCIYGVAEREFTIVGLATSPEYVYVVPSKHDAFVMPDSFGVVFITEDRAREWLGLGRRITEVHVATEPGREHEVLAKLDGLAQSYGVEVVYTQEDQPSKYMLTMDQQGLRTMSVFFPILFLSAAGLFLYVALSRIVHMQVTIIGMLRAQGFSRWQILAQYMAQGALVSAAGALPGAALGHGLALLMGRLYVSSLKLPSMNTVPNWDTIVAGIVLACATGLVSAFMPARFAAGLHPAVAMRGGIDGRGRGSMRAVLWTQFLSVLLRIPVRGLVRRPSRTLLAVVGIAGGAMIIVITFGQKVAVDAAMDEAFGGTRNYELDVALLRPEGARILHATGALEGVSAISDNVSVPVRIRTPEGSKETTLIGLEQGQQLMRIATTDGSPIHVEAGALWLTDRMARALHVEPGDPVRVEWLRSSRRQPVDTVMRVAGLAEVSMGSMAFGEIHDVRRTFADRVYPDCAYGAYVQCDSAVAEGLKHRLEDAPGVAMVLSLSELREQMDERMAVMTIFIVVMLIFGCVLSGSAVHSVGTVSLLERTRELATLRSLGFTARTISWLVTTELMALAVLGLILGMPTGYALNAAFLRSYETDSMAFTARLPLWVYALTCLLVLSLVSLTSYAGVRQLRRMDLSQATKARE